MHVLRLRDSDLIVIVGHGGQTVVEKETLGPELSLQGPLDPVSSSKFYGLNM